MKNHPLFPDHPDSDIEGFHVTRHGATGVEYAHPLHAPETVTDLSQIFELYGGGNYELVARGLLAGKNGEKGKKGIVARVSYRLGGEPKPLNPAAPGPAPVAAPAPPQGGGSDMAAMLQFFGQQMTAQMQLMTTIITASLQNRPQSDGGSVAAINALGEVVKAALTRPVHEAAAAPQMDPLKLVMDLGDWLNGVRQGAANVAAKVAAGQDPAIDLEQIAKFAEKAVDVVKKAKGLAEEGKSPHVAAEELAREAAAAE